MAHVLTVGPAPASHRRRAEFETATGEVAWKPTLLPKNLDVRESPIGRHHAGLSYRRPASCATILNQGARASVRTQSRC